MAMSWLWAGLLAATAAADVDQLLNALKSVGNEGRNNSEAARAWAELHSLKPERIPDLLKGLNGASPLAANWIRSAVDAILDRTLGDDFIPLGQLESFLADLRNDPRGRRLAYEIIARHDPGRAARLIPGLADDPSVELRRDAVALLIGQAEKTLKSGDQAGAVQAYLGALSKARDQDQVDAVAAKLGELGEKVDLARHFGFVLDWNVVGPFDSTDLKGFDQAFPPESAVDLESSYDGKEGKVAWKAVVSTEPYGEIDLNKTIGKHKFAASYAYTEFTSDKPQDVEFRLGSITSWKLWLNGELLFAQNEYHKGMMVDQYRVQGKLKRGANRILLKICQNNQTEPWAQDWKFQLRVCDATGTAILSTTRPAVVTEQKKPEKKPEEPKAKAKPAKETKTA